MNRLLKAALYRLKAQKLFWVLLGVSFVCGFLSAFILSSVLLFLFPLRLGFERVLLCDGMI